MKSVIFLIGLTTLLVGNAAAGEKYAPLNRIPAVAVYSRVDDNSIAIGIDTQRTADYVWSLLNDKGVPIDGHSNISITVSIQSIMLRSRYNPAVGSNTTAFLLRVDCNEQTDSGLVTYWADLRYGGYSSIPANEIIDDLTNSVTQIVNDFASDYLEDHQAASR